jgi:hypothetical protein
MVRRRRGQRPSGGRDRRRQVVLPVDVDVVVPVVVWVEVGVEE